MYIMEPQMSENTEEIVYLLHLFLLDEQLD